MLRSVTLTADQYDALLSERDAIALVRDALDTERKAWMEERANLRTELRMVTTERDLYHERLKLFQRRLFAAKSEARDPRQRDLFFNEAEALAPGTEPAQESVADGKIEVGAHRRTRRGRRPLDPTLPRVTVRHDLSEAERTCEHDGSTLVEIDVRIREQLDIVPEQIRVIRHEYPVYACPTCDQGMRTAPAPARIIPQSLFTEAALAWFVVANGTGPPERLFGYSPTRGTAQAAELYAGVRPGAGADDGRLCDV